MYVCMCTAIVSCDYFESVLSKTFYVLSLHFQPTKSEHISVRTYSTKFYVICTVINFAHKSSVIVRTSRKNVPISANI